MNIYLTSVLCQIPELFFFLVIVIQPLLRCFKHSSHRLNKDYIHCLGEPFSGGFRVTSAAYTPVAPSLRTGQSQFLFLSCVEVRL